MLYVDQICVVLGDYGRRSLENKLFASNFLKWILIIRPDIS
jgi:hypothetical protein